MFNFKTDRIEEEEEEEGRGKKKEGNIRIENGIKMPLLDSIMC